MAEGAVSSESVYKTLTLASGQESGASGESVQEVGGSELPPGRVSSTVTPLPLLHAQHIPHVGSLWGLIFFSLSRSVAPSGSHACVSRAFVAGIGS